MSSFGNGIEIFDINLGGGGTVTGADNGLHLDGTNVFLGGLLTEATTINVAAFDYILIGASGTDGTFFRINGNSITFQVTDNTPGAGKESLSQQTPHTNVMLVIDLGGGAGTTGLELLPFDVVTPRNVFLDDILLSGLSYKVPYLAGGLARYGKRYIPCLGDLDTYTPTVLAKGDFLARTAGSTLATLDFSLLDPALSYFVRVSTYINVNTITVGTAKLSGNFVNLNGTGQNVDFTPTVAALGQVMTSPVTLKANPNTQLDINLSITGTINVDCGYYVELLYTTN